MVASAATDSLREAANLHRAGALEAAEDRYQSAAANLPTRSSERYLALLGLTRVQVDRGRFESAAASCREAIACAPERSGPYGVLALTLVSAGELEAAAVAAAAARERAPQDLPLLNLSASIALRRGLPAQASAFCERALAADPHDQRALADLAFARGLLGDGKGSGYLLDTERLLHLSSVGIPTGFESLEAFHRGLAGAITGNAGLEAAERGATLSGGRRLADAFVLGPRWSGPLRAIFRAGLEDWLESTRVEATHPVVTGRPERLEIRAWANVMSAGDFEHPHLHEGGWLSGVYYVEMPEPSGTPAGNSPGALLLGGHPCAAPGQNPLLKIEPRAGQIVLFPSYFYHRTAPFTGPGRRISVAFDILREGRRRAAPARAGMS